jgi:hypothetical protein
MPTVVHVGLHKTATTSLQLNLFKNSARPYFGLHCSPGWETERLEWFPALMSGGFPPPQAGDGPFVFSDESILLRAGGLEGVTTLATSIRDRFSNPRVLVTARKPSLLLVSTYFQSLRVRRIAIGFRNGQAICQDSLRFADFANWWVLAKVNYQNSIAGLVDYAELLSRLRGVLGTDGVEVLPVEWINSAPDKYTNGLRRLGFTDEEATNFLGTSAENTRDSKSLDRARPWLYAAGKRLATTTTGERFSNMLPGPAKGLAERLIYSARRTNEPVGGPEPSLLASIDSEYDASWRQVVEPYR